ncbi:MAG: hypothetical protein MI974_23295 [Chitinophagales bacterium]|nr:hypothetical protein [Chitinophagales bacterium]
MKLICALDNTFKYQYQMFDAAVFWAIENREKLVAIANPKDGCNRSYYVCESVEQISLLEVQWNCNTTRALYTAVVNYLKYRGTTIGDERKSLRSI